MKFDDLYVGQIAESEKQITEEIVDFFAKASGDFNPIHFDEDFASKSIFKKRIAHGILSVSFISALIASELPGSGSVYMKQSLKFLKPVYLSDKINTRLTVLELIAEKRNVKLKTECLNQDGEIVIDGEALIKLLK